MGKGIYSAVTGAVASLRQLDTLANNLANVSTAGYKRQSVAFSEVLGQRLAADPPQDSNYVALAATRTNNVQGPLTHTESPLDVALEGPGYLVLREGNGKVYTRGGSLAVDTQGQLVGAGGRPLLDPRNKPIKVRGNAPITLGADGAVQQEGRTVGKLQLVEFAKPEALSRLADTLYKAPASQQEQAASRTRLRAGFIERSNVNAVREVTSMITASRSYEAFHRLISTFAEVDRAATRISTER